MGSLSALDERIIQRLDLPLQPINHRISRAVSWNKPASGCVKLNVDGSCRGNPGTCGGGGVIRDSVGTVLGGFSACFGQGTNNEAELRALKEGVALCKSLGYLRWRLSVTQKLWWIGSLLGVVQYGTFGISGRKFVRNYRVLVSQFGINFGKLTKLRIFWHVKARKG